MEGHFLDEAVGLDSAALKTLAGKVEILNNVRSQIKDLEAQVKSLSKTEQKMSREEIPGFMLQYGVRMMDVEGAGKIEVKEDLALNLPKTDPEKRKEVLRFISQNGGGGIIKDKLIVEDPTMDIIVKLNADHVDFERSQDVNTASLKAFARGLLGLKKNTVATHSVADFPKALNLYVYRETKISK